MTVLYNGCRVQGLRFGVCCSSVILRGSSTAAQDSYKACRSRVGVYRCVQCPSRIVQGVDKGNP